MTGAAGPAADGVGAAYSATGGAWQAGPGRIYDRLADELVDRCPGGVRGRLVVDLGAGTGAASRAADRAGAANVVAADLALGMLTHDAGRRPAAVVADLRSLPLRTDSAGAVIAAFSLNHVAEPDLGLAEAARVLAAGGGLVVASYATDDTHPVKACVDEACVAAGWVVPPWYSEIRAEAAPLLAEPDRAEHLAHEAGLAGASAALVRVTFPELGPHELVAWRLGMAQLSPFVAGLSAAARERLVDSACSALGPSPPPLVRSIVVLTWRAPG